MWAGRAVTTLVVLCWALTAHASPSRTRTPSKPRTPTPTPIPIDPSTQKCATPGTCDCFWDPIQTNPGIPTYGPLSTCMPACNGYQYRCRKVAVIAVDGGSCMVNGTDLQSNATVGFLDCKNITCNVGACPCQNQDGSPLCQNNGVCDASNGTAVCNCNGGYTGNRCEISPFSPPPSAPPAAPAQVTCDSSGGQPCSCVFSAPSQTECDPCSKKQYTCQKVITPAVNDGDCVLNGTDFNVTAKVGDLDCKVRTCDDGRTCNNNTAPTNGPCTPNGQPYCANNGWCYLDPTKQNAPACRCVGDKGGATCNETRTGNNTCAGNPCQNGALCFVSNDGSDYICNCTDGFYGKNCDSQPCNNFCQNGAPCTPRYGSPFCNCSAAATAPPANSIWSGASCNMSITTDPCAGGQNTCQNNGTLQGAYGKCRCVCPTGFSGDDCSVKAPAKNTCDTSAVVKCVSQVKVTGDPASPTAKCASFNAYSTCASNANCTDLLSLWCGVYFKQLPTCSIPKCSAIAGTCNMDVYQQCWAASQGSINNGNLCSGSILANCAAAADCNNLLLSFCANLDGCANRPADCNQFQKGQGSGQLVDLGKLPAWDILMPHKYYEGKQPQSESHAKLIVAAAVGVMVVVAVGVALRRRRMMMRGPMEVALVQESA